MHVFRSRVSVVLLLVLIASVLPIVFLEEPITDPNQAFLAYGILGLSMVLVFLLLFTLRYEIGEKHLFIKIGPFNYGKLNLVDIEKVERSYNPLSSPASSLKRLYIKGKGKDALISPANEKEFIQLLKKRNPSIEVEITDKWAWWRFWDWDI